LHDRVGNTDEEVLDEGPRRVLDIHHLKNKSIRAPDPNKLRRSSHGFRVTPTDGHNHSHSFRAQTNAPVDGRGSTHGPDLVPQAGGSRARTNAPVDGRGSTHGPDGGSRAHTNAPADGRGSTHGPDGGSRAHTNAPVDGHGSTHGSDRVPGGSRAHTHGPDGGSHAHTNPVDDRGNTHGPDRFPGGSRRSFHTANLEADSDGDNEGDENELENDHSGKTRATRNSKSQGDAKPSQLGFYHGTWVNILIDARNNYRKRIHSSQHDPFPERNTESLRDAQDLLLEVISDFRDRGTQVDEGLFIFSFLKLTNNMIGVYNRYCTGMIAYVSYNVFLLNTGG
jgi:hypothetical protein